ncbi:MAG: GDP-mannose 4,6-dehydratase [Xanthobacteraceae bacterium]|nr:GDP-mannose 4,6-dehydratase [Xanthobacteraceae bacterium]MBX3550078.1 GDP-mannose 4,6-dehydratase [Xanthobacteraceae bacterium]MCW5673383.1 GDP-mannose 4,6-dehydratase [Xanthobacteraceae bacterium]
MRFLITGTAGFVGFNLAKRLLADGHEVQGIDALTPYYDVELKKKRHGILAGSNRFTAHVANIEDAKKFEAIHAGANPDVIVHLAAQAGVRYSLENPEAYVRSNVDGTFNLLEIMRRKPPKHFIFASTSSVYGANKKMPFVETERADHPLTLYAATKKAGELMAHSYSHLFGIPTTVVRFFTVYGPWGRPDMALFKFTDAILKDKPIDVYGEGRMSRDFTFIDDLVEAIARLVPLPPELGAASDAIDSLSPAAAFRVVNIGGGSPVELTRYIEAIEEKLGKKAIRNMMPMQPGDVRDTFASADLLEELTGYRPSTPVEEGVAKFVDWYRDYFRV